MKTFKLYSFYNIAKVPQRKGKAQLERPMCLVEFQKQLYLFKLKKVQILPFLESSKILLRTIKPRKLEYCTIFIIVQPLKKEPNPPTRKLKASRKK